MQEGRHAHTMRAEQQPLLVPAAFVLEPRPDPRLQWMRILLIIQSAMLFMLISSAALLTLRYLKPCKQRWGFLSWRRQLLAGAQWLRHDAVAPSRRLVCPWASMGMGLGWKAT